jgi:hypothetical protein
MRGSVPMRDSCLKMSTLASNEYEQRFLRPCTQFDPAIS